MTKVEIKKLVMHAKKSKKAEFLEATDQLSGISRDQAAAVWKAAKFMRKLEQMEAKVKKLGIKHSFFTR
jgi:hemoglobin-like flavoprotein